VRRAFVPFQEKRGLRERIPRNSRLLGVLAICALQLGVAVAKPKTGQSAASSSSFSDVPVVLQTFPTAHLDITLMPCITHDCAIQVRLVEDGKISDRLTLPVRARLLHPKAEAVDESWGADPGLKAWRTGFESDYVSTTGRLVTLAPGATGLLVTQRHTFEPMKHEHLLVLARKGKLKVVWKADAGAATWSTTQLIHGLPGFQDIAYLQISPGPDGMSNHFEASRLRWDPATAKLQPTPLPDDKQPLYVLGLGKYESTAKAREARTNYSFCLTSYWVLDASAFPAHAQAVIGKVFAHRAAAETAAQQSGTCMADQKPVIVAWPGTIPAPGPPPAASPPPKPQGKAKAQSSSAPPAASKKS
jgi:hypothetical protein